MLGTPNEQSWPGVSALPDYKPSFPNWVAKELKSAVPNLEPLGLDLLTVSAWSHARSPSLIRGVLQKMLVYEPNKRITAKAALKHPFFADLERAKAQASGVSSVPSSLSSGASPADESKSTAVSFSSSSESVSMVIDSSATAPSGKDSLAIAASAKEAAAAAQLAAHASSGPAPMQLSNVGGGGHSRRASSGASAFIQAGSGIGLGLH